MQRAANGLSNRIDLTLCIIIALAGFAAVYFQIQGILRVALALPLIFLIPGYVLQSALLPTNEISNLWQLILSVVLSFTITMLGTVIMYFLGIPLTAVSWGVWLSGFTLIASIAALIRQLDAQEPNRLSEKILQQFGQMRRVSITPKILRSETLWLSVIAIGLLAAALTISRMSAVTQAQPGFTQLWINSSESPSLSIEVGISNQENSAQDYRLTLYQNDALVNEWSVVTLEKGQTLTETYALPAPAALDDSFEARLYRLDAPDTLYRQVKLASKEN